jgi:hypothetical protein
MNGKMEFQATFLRICMDLVEPEEGNLAGSICGVGLEDSCSFESTPELLLLIDQCLDRIGKPQATRKTRSFRDADGEEPGTFRPDPPLYHTSEEIRARRGKCRTADIHIVTRYHSSWQGILYDEEGERKGTFSSDLQLLKLLLSPEEKTG